MMTQTQQKLIFPYEECPCHQRVFVPHRDLRTDREAAIIPLLAVKFVLEDPFNQ